MAKPFEAGDRILFIDRRDRRYFVTLESGEEFHTHTGLVKHDDVIGALDGSEVKGTGGSMYLLLRPRLSDIVLKMPRGAQVIYPKDLGQILMQADIFPGAKVLEAGVGSGALSMTMLRAGAHITGYEIREDFAQHSRKNVRESLGDAALEHYDVQVRDIYDGIDGEDFDRVVLDLPEPWRAVKHIATALVSGGVLISYLPSITQVVTLRDALRESSFGLIETTEILERGWHIEGQSVRPDHRMVAHTGFLTVARRLADAGAHG